MERFNGNLRQVCRKLYAEVERVQSNYSLCRYCQAPTQTGRNKAVMGMNSGLQSVCYKNDLRTIEIVEKRGLQCRRDYHAYNSEQLE